MITRKLTFSLSLAALLLATGSARAQTQPEAAQRSRAAAGQPAEWSAADADEVEPDEMPAVRRLVEDEAVHRDRLARIHRLRELATSDRDHERLARLDDLERRENQAHEARRIRSRERLSDRSWDTTENFVRRGGVMRVRSMDQQAMRERAANHKSARERAAQASQASRSSQPSRSSSSRPASRPSSRPSSGGRSPR